MAISERVDWQAAVAEEITYRYLARALMDPDEASWSALRDVHGPALASVEPSDARLAGAMRELLACVAETSLAVARVARRALFPPVETPDCPTYESAYRGRDVWGQSNLMADVAGFYRAHGLRVGAPIRERPDHIGVELEFMSVVAHKEADAIARGAADQVAICRESGDAFLRDHLGCWAMAFGRRVGQLATAPHLRAAGELLALWVETELDARSIEPVEQVAGPTPAAFGPVPSDDTDDADVSCAPGAGALPIIPLESVTRRPVTTGEQQ